MRRRIPSSGRRARGHLSQRQGQEIFEPLARQLDASILLPLDVRTPGQMEAVFEHIAKDWGELDFVVHSIAFAPKETLCGRVVDAERTAF